MIGKLNLWEVNHLLRLSLFSHTAEFNDRGEATDIPGDIPGSGHAHHLEMGYWGILSQRRERQRGGMVRLWLRPSRAAFFFLYINIKSIMNSLKMVKANRNTLIYFALKMFYFLILKVQTFNLKKTWHHILIQNMFSKFTCGRNSFHQSVDLDFFLFLE